jgi:uncharacterized protein YdhG (YjbR/CyaY superfamily)
MAPLSLASASPSATWPWPPEGGIGRFADEIVRAGYEYSKELIRIPWDGPVDFALLDRIIAFNILDKAECTTFWRR